MSRYSLVFAAVLLAACSRGPQSPAAAPTQVRTIDSVDPRPTVIDPPSVLTDEAPPPKPKVMPWETPKAVVFTPEDEKVRAALPFTPAIAMDPVDGSKISIRATTPTLELKKRIYYFSSEENKRTFAANPDSFLTGRFTKL